jgi:hypothetical protein
MEVMDSSGQCVFKLHLTADEQGIKAGDPAFEEAEMEARLRARYSST